MPCGTMNPFMFKRRTKQATDTTQQQVRETVTDCEFDMYAISLTLTSI